MSKKNLISGLLVFAFFLIIYTSSQSQSIFGGDAGDLVTAAATGGVAHPAGYPLYTVISSLLIHFIPTGSIAWRVSFLSSVPLSLALGLLTIYIGMTSGSSLAAIFSTITLGTSYLYWLYAIVPEVFSLHLFFMAAQLLMLQYWHASNKRLPGILFVTFFVLSLFHHQIILFMMPAYAYFGYSNKKKIRRFFIDNKSEISIASILSLLPLAYFVYSIPKLSLYTWEDTLTITNIIKILLRSTYGSFTSAAEILQTPFARLTDIYAYFTIAIEDLTLPALIISIIGSGYQFKTNRKHFNFTVLAFVFTGPIFFFYGAYILTNNFTIATFERFIMPSYFFITIWLAYGFKAFYGSLSALVWLIRSRTEETSQLQYLPMLFAAFLIIPLNLLFINYEKMHVLTHDNTAEKLSENILNTTEKNSIVLLSDDNGIFNTSYIHFAYGYRKDDAVINSNQIFNSRKIKNLIRNNPTVIFPDIKDKLYIEKFVTLNEGTHPIYSTSKFLVTDNYVWIREGLLYRLFNKKNLPSESSILKKNNELWNSYYDPLAGSLGSFKHLMLSTNLLLYRLYREETGDYFYVAKRYSEAEVHYRAALRYEASSPLTYQKLSIALMGQKKCDEALRILDEVYNKFPKSSETSLYYVKFYTECTKDDEKIKFWKQHYDSSIQKTQEKLNTL